jgi:hypothetical protein
VKSKILLLIVSIIILTCHKPLPVPKPVILQEPLDEMVLRQKSVEFQWQSIDEAIGYNIQIAEKTSFSKPIIDTTITDATLNNELIDGNYFWRVRAFSKDSVWGEWSDTWSFKVERYQVVSQNRTYGYAHDVFVSKPYAYIADGQAGLTILNIMEPQEPVIVSNIMDTLHEAWGVAVDGDYAYLAYSSVELRSINIGDPENPRFVGILEHPTPASGYEIVVQDNLAYIAALSQFIIADIITDTLYPPLLYQHLYPANVRGISVLDSFAVIACEQLGIYIYNVNEPRNAKIVGWCNTPGNARDVFINDSFAFVADGTDGLVIFNIKDKTNPQLVSGLDLPGYARKIYVVDDLLYIALGDSGLGIIDISNPNEAKLDAIVKTKYAYSVYADSKYIYVATGRDGLTIVAKEAK